MAEIATHVLHTVIVGTNHRTGALPLRDKLFVEDGEVPDFLSRVTAQGLAQAIVLSTCDRVEIVALSREPEAAQQALTDLLAERAELPAEDLAPSLYHLAHADAVRQIFAVAASLDSQVIGEPQVLGQVKACHGLARESGCVGGELEGLLQAAYATAKRVRTETAIGERPVSIASSAAELVRDLHGDLGRIRGLLIGTGDMGHTIVSGLMQNGLKKFHVTHPRLGRAERLAESLGCAAADYDTLGDLLPEADVVVTAVSGRSHVLDPDRVNAALRARRRQPIFLVDTGVPGDVDPAVNRIDDAFLYDLGDLERVAKDGLNGREAVSEKAWRIVDEAVEGFTRDLSQRDAVPLVVRLRTRFEAERLRVLAEAPDDADKATRLLAARLLHGPSEALRGAAAVGANMEDISTLLDRLFGLDRPEEGGER